MARDWTQDEVEAAVADYFAMLGAELRGENYVKAEHRRSLMSRLDERTECSVERKHQNISAVLIELGLPYITGYKPLGNYQGLLGVEVERYVDTHPELLQAVQEDVQRPAEPPALADYLSALVDPPSDVDFAPGVVLEEPAPFGASRRPRTNYLEREARNRSLGAAGEEFVVNFERARLAQVGDGGLADRIEHVSRTLGDGAGFDIRSFDERGGDLFIEVKTTRYGMQTPFFVSSNELRFSRSNRDTYGLYRVFAFREDPKLFVLEGAVDESCSMRPHAYRAWPPQAV